MSYLHFVRVGGGREHGRLRHFLGKGTLTEAKNFQLSNFSNFLNFLISTRVVLTAFVCRLLVEVGNAFDLFISF